MAPLANAPAGNTGNGPDANMPAAPAWYPAQKEHKCCGFAGQEELHWLSHMLTMLGSRTESPE